MDANQFYRFAEPTTWLEERITIVFILACVILNVVLIIREKRRKK